MGNGVGKSGYILIKKEPTPTELELEQAKVRIKQLEENYKLRTWATPPEPDPTLAQDEWWAIFGDHTNLTSGSLSKVPWQGGSNMTSTFKVKRVY